MYNIMIIKLLTLAFRQLKNFHTLLPVFKVLKTFAKVSQKG